MELNEVSANFLKRLLQARAIEKYGEEVTVEEARSFWGSENVVEWFKGKGYTPYTMSDDPQDSGAHSEPSLPYDLFAEADYPYAYHDAVIYSGQPSLETVDHTRRIIYAQDSQRRHVVIKMTHTGTDEYRILRLLSEQDMEALRESCILPVLELIHFQEACFVVMPRWGAAVDRPSGLLMAQIICIMESMLKALTFLHSHNIIYRDISTHNMLINHFGNESSPQEYWDTRYDLRLQGKLCYALIDFDLSILAPSSAKKGQFRLPYIESWCGSYHPLDNQQCEFDYDPFAYDVGALGNIFCCSYQHNTRDVPLLAPLLDGMITRDIPKRFTAAEALQFLQENVKAKLSEEQMSLVYLAGPYEPYETFDRWKHLPVEFQQEWAAFRQQPLKAPLTTRLLRIAYSHPVSFYPVMYTRWFVFKLTSIPRIVWGQLTKHEHRNC